MTVDRDTVTRIAQLARVEIPESDLGSLAEDLSKILLWVEQLDEIDTGGVEPMTNLNQTGLRWRDDAVTDGSVPQDITANAPDTRRNMFCVPKVVE